MDSSPKILIVDDNQVNIMILEKMLKINNYRNIITTNDPFQVLEIYKRNKPDLILLDLKMPGLDGFQVMEQLYKHDSRECIPIIMITAQNDKENRMKALELGVRDFIGKPFDQAELIMRIKNNLDIKIKQNKMRVENIILKDKVNEGTQVLEKMQLELIQRLLKAAEFRDSDTGEHINRIGMYAYELSNCLGMSKGFSDTIIYASMLHDIGKIGIPDNILLKKSELSKEEWEIMKDHTKKGAQILTGSNSEILKMGEVIATTHHERWNGEGYPYGISGEDIPIEGRITSICDVFDALFSERTYKKPWVIDQVIKEIKNERGKQFDPWITDVFLENINIFNEIRHSV